MSEHTPGPWHVGDGEGKPEWTVWSEGRFIANCRANPDVIESAYSEMRANARLIRAAPDLLEEHQRSRNVWEFLLEGLGNLATEQYTDEELANWIANMRTIIEPRRQASAKVIAKAKEQAGAR